MDKQTTGRHASRHAIKPFRKKDVLYVTIAKQHSSYNQKKSKTK